MEITCTRCHQTVQTEDCYCPSCGLPQLVYTADTPPGQAPPERWTEAVRDASMVDWKPAIRAAIALAFPAGLLSSVLSPVGMLGLFLDDHRRGLRRRALRAHPGARPGSPLAQAPALGWSPASWRRGWPSPSAEAPSLCSGMSFTIPASLTPNGRTAVLMSQQMTQQMSSGMGAADSAEAQAVRTRIQAWMLSPWGHAGVEAFGLAGKSVFPALLRGHRRRIGGAHAGSRAPPSGLTLAATARPRCDARVKHPAEP